MTAAVIEDMRSVEPLEYIRAVGLRPEDCYGFLPLDLHDVAPYLLPLPRPARVRAEADRAPGRRVRAAASAPVEVMPAQETEIDLERTPGGGQLADVIAQAQQMQQAWSGQAPGAPAAAPDRDRIERVEKLKEIGAINEEEYGRLLDRGRRRRRATPRSRRRRSARRRAAAGHAQDLSGDADALLAPASSTTSAPATATRSSSAPRTSTASSRARPGPATARRRRRELDRWDDFWIVYRDRGEYAQGREAWAREMNKKGDWPEPVITPGVAEPGSAAFDGAKFKVEKDRWPREKVVMRKQGSDLGEALREKIAEWGYEPEDSLRLLPQLPNGSIYFAWAKR